MHVVDRLSLNADKKHIFYEAMARLEEQDMNEDILLTKYNPLAYSSKLENGAPCFQQEMNGPQADSFYEEMVTEMNMLDGIDPWEIVPRDNVGNSNILDTTWAFKVKRYPDGSIRKCKAKICVRGNQQEYGYNYFDMYAPAVSWNTVRLLIIVAALLGLSTKQVDYTLAFVQAKLDPTDLPIFIEMPRMFEKPAHVLRLKRSLYGLRQTPLNFFLHLKKGLEQRNFK